MNIAVINIKDIFKITIRIVALIILIYISSKLFIISDILKQNKIKVEIEQGVDKVNRYSFTECLDVSISLISYKKKNIEEKDILSSDKILAMGAGIFEKSIHESEELIVNEKNLIIENNEETENQILKLPDNVTTENVEENNIIPKYTSTYGTVKVNNQSKYDLTEDILKPDVEISNKNDILIYHTHTCESYTPSERI